MTYEKEQIQKIIDAITSSKNKGKEFQYARIKITFEDTHTNWINIGLTKLQKIQAIFGNKRIGNTPIEDLLNDFKPFIE